MLILVAAAVGVAAVLGLSLVLKLRSIRKRGFGEGSPLELPRTGLALRHPHWWKRAREEPPGTAPEPPIARRSEVLLKTGHSRGMLRITDWREDPIEDRARGEASLREGLAAYLREQGLELDDPGVTVASAGPGTQVWVASGGRQASLPEERSYFEVHLLALGGARVLFSYRNSVLQGFLDAYYLEKVLETVQPARFPR